MKKYFVYFLMGGISLSLLSCGGAKQEEKPDNPLEALSKLGEEIKTGTDDAQKKMDERKKKGDTLAMKYEDLMKYLPKEISGYTKGDPDGTSISAMGQSYSTATVKFKNGENTVQIQIMDYNQAYGLYSSAAMMWSMGFSVDSPEEKAGGVKFENNIAGWELFNKKSKDAEVTLGAGYRFWIHVEANDQENTDFVKSVAKSIDLAALAAL